MTHLCVVVYLFTWAEYLTINTLHRVISDQRRFLYSSHPSHVALWIHLYCEDLADPAPSIPSLSGPSVGLLSVYFPPDSDSVNTSFLLSHCTPAQTQTGCALNRICCSNIFVLPAQPTLKPLRFVFVFNPTGQTKQGMVFALCPGWGMWSLNPPGSPACRRWTVCEPLDLGEDHQLSAAEVMPGQLTRTLTPGDSAAMISLQELNKSSVGKWCFVVHFLDFF